MNAHQIVEAVLFASDAPLTADEIARADEMLDEDQVEEALRFLRAEYDDAARSFQLHELAEGYQILTRPEYAPYLERFDNVPKSSRLSGPALETLAIIAYRQPIGRLEVEYIRGVNASGVIRTLQDRRLIDVVGRAEGLGRPLLYGTTRFFLEHFGFGSLEDLPRPEELPVVLRERVPLGSEQAAAEEVEVEGAHDVDAASGEAGEASETSEESEAGMEQEASATAYAGADSESGIALGGERAEESDTESTADGEVDGSEELQDEPELES